MSHLGGESHQASPLESILGDPPLDLVLRVILRTIIVTQRQT
jgi:hypothetical protein